VTSGAGVWINVAILVLKTLLVLVQRSVKNLVEFGPVVHTQMKDIGRINGLFYIHV